MPPLTSLPHSQAAKLRLGSDYVPEIEGLRGLAVILVLVFHAGFWWLPGGFIGVDIFFFISGFLITRQILRQLHEGRFTFSEFYLRRVRRLAPAMLATVAGTLILGFALLSLSEFRNLGIAALSSLFGVANFYFSGQTDYFSVELTTKPLLHFWSLCVEEQFYLVAPFILVLAFSSFSFRGVFWVSLAIMFCSFLGATVLFQELPKQVFFWSMFRSWEFTFGGMLLWVAEPKRVISVLLTIVGLCLIFVSSIIFSPGVGGWSVANLIPCTGAALIITASQNPVKRLIFGNPLVVGIGRISYSLYLVHWPIIVYILFLQTGRQLNTGNQVLAICLSVIAAIFMFKSVEQRFRHSTGSSTDGQIKSFIVGSFKCWVVLSVISIAIAVSSGWKWRILAETVQDGEGYGSCKREPLCAVGTGADINDVFNVILVGDSHAKHLSAGLESWIAEFGGTALVATSPSCIPLEGSPLPKVNKDQCFKVKENLPGILNRSPNATVIISQSWRGYDDFQNLLLRYFTLLDAKSSKRKIFVVGQIPKLPREKVNCGTMHSFLLPRDICSPFPIDEAALGLNQKLGTFVTNQNLAFVNPMEMLCDEETCVTQLDGYSAYFDSQHITEHVSNLLIYNFIKP